MKYDYQYKITFKLGEDFDVNYVNRICRQYPNARILVEVQNTKGITSQMLRKLTSNNFSIRIAGGYDQERCERRKDIKFNNGEDGSYYNDAVIYTKNEAIKIVEAIEKIEKGINPRWSQLQKLIYVYDRLKTGIMYDPKYEKKFSCEIRSLRGLLTKQTVCAGYSMILKEFMDRQGIECEYVEGSTHANGDGAHAWNIITIDGKKYPIDLTWDNTAFRSGKSKTFDWLGQNIKDFSKKHYPAKGEKTQDYERTLSQIPPQFIKGVYSQIRRARDYQSTTYQGERKDGSKFTIAQVGEEKFYNTTFYRYYYVEDLPDGRKGIPLLLYSETNLTNLINRKRFGKNVPAKYEDVICNILFSRENIQDSLSKKTYYIGRSTKENIFSNKRYYVESIKDIKKDEGTCEKFTFPTRCYTRKDGTVFIAQKMSSTPFNVKGVDVIRYDIFEMVLENGERVLKRNTVYTEKDFFLDKRNAIQDDLLSRDRLDRKVGEAGGYIGYLDVDGVRTYNPDLVAHFETSKRLDLDTFKEAVAVPKKDLPTFDEIKALASKYDIHMDFDNLDSSEIEIRDIETGEVITNQDLKDKAMFANIWLAAAGVKYMTTDKRPGDTYAFNSSAEDLYNIICHDALDSAKEKGVVDTAELFKTIRDKAMYKHAQDIVVKLFRTPMQTELFNKMVLQATGQKVTSKPETLYSMQYAGSLAYSDPGSMAL